MLFCYLVKGYFIYFSLTKTEPDIGSCDDETDCNNNGECINNYCKCKPGFDDKDYPKDCSRKLNYPHF